MSEPKIKLHYEGSLAFITLNQPKRRNPLGLEFSDAMLDILNEINRNRSVDCVILTGAGRVFCGGGDLAEIMSTGETDQEKEFTLIRGYNKVISAIYHLDRPVIAAVNGPAVGGGTCVAMACDIAIAAPSARYDFLFGRIGLSSADMGATYLLNRLVGPVRASHLMLSGASIDAEQGLKLGVFSQISASEDKLLDDARALANKICEGSRRASTITKLSLRRAPSMDFDACLEYEAYLQSFAFRTEGHKSRLSKILEQLAAARQQ